MKDWPMRWNKMKENESWKLRRRHLSVWCCYIRILKTKLGSETNFWGIYFCNKILNPTFHISPGSTCISYFIFWCFLWRATESLGEGEEWRLGLLFWQFFHHIFSSTYAVCFRADVSAQYASKHPRTCMYSLWVLTEVRETMLRGWCVEACGAAVPAYS